MTIQVVLVDINAKMVQAWRDVFEDEPDVKIVHGSMLDQDVDAWVSPTNARGNMDGGLDAIIKGRLGAKIEARLKLEIGRLYNGFLPLGHATCVETGMDRPRYLISTPTMTASSQDVSDTMNVALACAAAFQAAHMQNARKPGGIASIALPGLGANTGKVPVEICADLMWTGYSLFRERQFEQFGDIRAALEEQLGDLGPSAGHHGTKKSATPKHAPLTQPPNTSSPKAKDVDFDDFG